MIGAYDSLPGSGQMILAVARGKMKFYTSGGRNYVFVMDVATAIANALEKGTIGKYYIAGNENLTYKEFLTKTASIVQKSAPKIQVPGCVVKAIGYLGTLTGTWLGIQPLISYPMAQISCEKQFVSSEDAVAELKMPQTSIEIAIRECFQWFLENNYIKQNV
jgi:nucleoside-diphosphate-sugar epimerase